MNFNQNSTHGNFDSFVSFIHTTIVKISVFRLTVLLTVIKIEISFIFILKQQFVKHWIKFIYITFYDIILDIF